VEIENAPAVCAECGKRFWVVYWSDEIPELCPFCGSDSVNWGLDADE
jgi:predicted Zn-ribbon and HTH transcriptional regulator